MNIRILKKGTEDFKRLSEVKWKLYSIRKRNNILFFLISGMSLIFLNFFVKKKELHNLTPELAIGFGLLITGLFSLYHHIKSKRIFFDQLSTIINDPDNINGEFILEIDNHSVRMAGPSFSFTQKWSNIIDLHRI